MQPYAYTLLVLVAILGLALFGDFPDGWTLLGAAIIVASGLYTWHHDRRAARVTSTCRTSLVNEMRAVTIATLWGPVFFSCLLQGPLRVIRRHCGASL